MFMYGGRNKKVNSAVSNANLLMQNHMGFVKAIKDKETFTMTEVDAEDVSLFMKDRYMNSIQRVRVRYPWNPFSKAIAYFKPSLPNTITLNARRLKRSEASITGTILHEYVHLVDNYYSNARFGHGTGKTGNYSYKRYPVDSVEYYEKKNSAPYSIGILAKEFAAKYID